METNTALNQYVPDYLVSPGEILAEYLEAYGMTQTELADQLVYRMKKTR